MIRSWLWFRVAQALEWTLPPLARVAGWTERYFAWETVAHTAAVERAVRAELGVVADDD